MAERIVESTGAGGDKHSQLATKRVQFDYIPSKHPKTRKRNRPLKKGQQKVAAQESVTNELVAVKIPIETSYEVEEILGHRIRVDTGLPEFLLKWKGYPNSENSWEPPANLDGCSKMLYKYITEKVIQVNGGLHVEVFADLLPVRLRKTSSKPSTTAKQEHKLNTGRNSTEKLTTKTRGEAKNGHIKYRRKKLPSSPPPSEPLPEPLPEPPSEPPLEPLPEPPSEPLPEPPPEPSSRTTKEHTLSKCVKQRKSARKQLFVEPVSETNPPSKTTAKPAPLCLSTSPRKEQENVPKDQRPSVRTHPSMSLKECPLFYNEAISHPNDTLKHLPPSPDATLSPLAPDRRNRLSSTPSINDSLPFHLHLTPSPQSPPIHNHSPCNGFTSSHLNSSISSSKRANDSKFIPQSEARQIPKHLLHNQKLFTTPVPLPRAKRKNGLCSSVPTKAAKLSPAPPPHQKRRSLGSCKVPVLNKVIRSNGKLVATEPSDLGERDIDTKNKQTVQEESSSLSREKTAEFEDVTRPDQNLEDESPLAKIGRDPESAASLLYKEILLNWQHELNKQRDGTDEFIIVENYVDRVPPPTNFTYISSNHYASGVPDPSSPEVSSSLCGCECYSLGKKCGTRSASFCCPKMANAQFAYSRAGKVQVEPGTPIYECNSRCSCPPDCGNKVVQHGRKIPLCIFRTGDGRGWGVKTMQPIKAHSFVTEYVGEVITSEEAEKRGRLYDQQGATYLFDLDFDDDNSEFTIDAAREGNISHFFNHSCQPNLVVYSVWIECLDKRLPRIAFFTTRNVSAGEELTFDYQMNHDQSVIIASPSRHKKMRTRCLCGSEKCLGYYY